MRVRDHQERATADEHRREPEAGVIARGPASSNPAREVAAALRAGVERHRGRRDRAMRELSMRAVDPEWRDGDEIEGDPENLGEAPPRPAPIHPLTGRPDEMAAALDAAAEAAESPDASARPVPPTLPRPPVELDARWLRPPEDLLLRDREWPGAPAEDALDPDDLDAKRRRRPDGVEERERPQPPDRPELAQHRRPDRHAGRSSKPTEKEKDRKDPRKRPLPGLKTTDAAKRARQLQQMHKEYDLGPGLKKKGVKPPAREKPRPLAKAPPPAKKEAPEKKEPEKKEGEGVVQVTAASDGGGAAVSAWEQRQKKKIDAIKVEPVPDAQRYVVEYQAAATKAEELTPIKKLELLEQAEKSVEKVDNPKDAPKLTSPNEFVQAETTVRDQAERKIPEQVLPDLEPTPLGNRPEVGMKLRMGDDRQWHIYKETKGPDGKITRLEYKVVPEDAKPSTDDKVVQIKTPKPGKDLQKNVEKLRAAGEKKRVEVEKQGRSKGQRISDDRRTTPPQVPPFAQVDMATVIAKVFAQLPKHTQKVVEDARGAWAGGTFPAEEASAFLAQEQGPISEELHKVAKGAGVTDEALAKKRAEEERKLKESVEKEHDKKEDAAAKTNQALQKKGAELEGHIGAVASGMEASLQEKKVAAEGGSEPDQIRKQRDEAKKHIGALVSKWRGEYRRMGKERVRQLDDAMAEQSDAYNAAAEIDYRQIDLQLGVKTPDRKKAWDEGQAPREEYQPTKTWLGKTLKELRDNVGDLRSKATETAEGYVTDISAAGDTAYDLIEGWADKLIAKEKSWWQKLKDWIASWFGHARKQVRQWETDSTEDNNVNVNNDQIWLARAKIYQYDQLSEDAIKERSGFTEEQKAMLLALKSSKGDSATALAAGLVARLSQQRRDGLFKKFEEKVLSWTDLARVEPISIGQGGKAVAGAGWAKRKAMLIRDQGIGRPGTGESEILGALGGLTKIQGHALSIAYKDLTGHDLRADLRSELYDWTQQLTGSVGEYDRATALLEGNQAREIAIQLYQAMHETFLGTGLGTDSKEIFKLLKGKTADEIAAIKREYKAYYGKDLMIDAAGELDDGFSTRHDSDRFVAVMSGRPDVARAIEADSTMRGSIFGRTDRAGLEQVYKDIADEVEKEAEKKGWDSERVQREIAKRYAALDSMYEGIYGSDFDPSKRRTGESALRTAMRENFTWGSGKAAWNLTTSTGDLDMLLSYHDFGLAKDTPNIKQAWRTHIAEVSAAKIQIEHRSFIYADDKEIDKALAAQSESTFKDEVRDRKLKLKEEETKDREDAARRYAEAEKKKDPAALKAAKEYERSINRKWAKEGPEYLARMRELRADAAKATKEDSEKNKDFLGQVYEKRYRQWNKQHNFGEDKSFGEVVRGDTGYGNWAAVLAGPAAGFAVEAMRSPENDKTLRLLETGGYLSAEEKLEYSIKGEGTDEDTAKAVFAEMDSVEAQETLTKLGLKRQGKSWETASEAEKAAAYESAKEWVLSDFSGREYQDQYIAMMGVPHTPEEHLKVAEKRREFEYNSGPRKFANFLDSASPFGAPFMATPFTAPLGGLLLGGPTIASGLRGIDAGALETLDAEVAALRDAVAKAQELEKQGFAPGDPEYDKVLGQISQISMDVKAAQDSHRSVVDAYTDIVTTIVTVVVMIVVTVIGILASPFTGGASAAATVLLWSAVIGALTAAVANMAVKYALKGDAYGWEEIGYDAVMAIVEAVAAGLTAGLGDKFLKAGFLMKMAQGGFLNRMAAHGLANAAEGIIQALPGALVGNVLNDENYRQGNPFANIMMGTVTQVGMAGAMSGVMGGLIGGIKKPTHFIDPSTDAYKELFHQYKLKNPGATPEKFRLDLHETILRGEHPGLSKKHLEGVARDQILQGLEGDAAKQFKKLKVEVLPADEFARATGSKQLGEAVVMIRNGEPHVVVKAGADFANLHREATHLMQSLRDDMRAMMAKLDEKVLGHWDKLPVGKQVELYKTKLKIEIDAHQQMLKQLDTEKAAKRFGERLADEIEYTEKTLANLKRLMKEAEAVDVEAIRTGKLAKPDFLEDPPRLFTKKLPKEGADVGSSPRPKKAAAAKEGAEAVEPKKPKPHEDPKWLKEAQASGAVDPSFRVDPDHPTLTKAKIKELADKGYVIHGDELDPFTPVLKPRAGGTPTEDLMLISTGEGATRRFKAVPREGMPYGETPAGHQWVETDLPDQKYRVVAVRGADPPAVQRYNVEKNAAGVLEGKWTTATGKHKNWAERKVDLGRPHTAPSDFELFETKLKALDLEPADQAALRKWAKPMKAFHDAPELAGARKFLDEAFAELEQRLAKNPGKGLTESQYEAFYEGFRTKFGKAVGEQPPAVRQRLLQGVHEEVEEAGKKIVKQTKEGLLDTLDPASKGHFFREVARTEMGPRIKELPEAKKIPLKHAVPEKAAAPGKPPPTREFDDVFQVKARLGENGPDSGAWGFEYKAGPGAFKVDQAIDYAAIIKKAETAKGLKGGVYVFDSEANLLAALDQLEQARRKKVPGIDVLDELLSSEPRRLHFGYYDKDGNLKFMAPPETGAAGFVPGAGFHGHGLATLRSAQATEGLAGRALAGVGDVHPHPTDPTKHTVKVPGHGDVEVRVIAVSVGTNKVADAAQFRFEPPSRATIFVSDRATGPVIERAMHHEIAELREIASGRAGAADLLRRGRVTGAQPSQLSGHDVGRLAEIEWIAGRLQTARGAARRELRAELHAMIEELGLRQGTPGAAHRRRLIDGRLGAEAMAVLDRTRVPIGRLDPDDRLILGDVRTMGRAQRRLAEQAAIAARPAHPAPSLRRAGDPTDRPLTRRKLERRADLAARRRARVEEKTWQKYERDLAAGRPVPIDSPWIGAGASAAGVPPGTLLVDARGRWHIDLSDDIAQTARQLEAISKAGLGLPLEAALPDQRVPLHAVRAWEDLRVAHQALLRGHGSLELEPGGTFTLHVFDKGPPPRSLRFPGVTGRPVIGTGFPREIVPAVGTGAGAPRLRANTVDHVEVQRARVATEAAEREFEALQVRSGGRVFLGDQANELGFDPTKANEWVVVSLGGTGISAAEIILKDPNNRHISVKMVGSSWTEGIRTNPQYARVSADPRFRTPEEGFRLDRIVEVPGPGGTTLYHVQGSTTAGGPHPGYTAEGVVVSIGGRNKAPPPIADAVKKAQDRGQIVTGKALFDDDGHYVGYQLRFPSGHRVDVTGAASRFPPNDVRFSKRDLDRIARHRDLVDAPPESGNFSGGFAPSAVQADRYRRWRLKNP